MPEGIRWVGLDMHARESTFAIFDRLGRGHHEEGGRPSTRAAPVAARGGERPREWSMKRARPVTG